MEPDVQGEGANLRSLLHSKRHLQDGCQGTYGAGTKAMLTHPWLINYIMNSNDNALIAASIAINPDWKACKGKLDCTGTPEQLEKNLALVNDTVRTYEPGVWFLSSGHVLDAANCPATMLADVSAGKVSWVYSSQILAG
jgi:hypothetical protein